jgi:hypothetical protein
MSVTITNKIVLATRSAARVLLTTTTLKKLCFPSPKEGSGAPKGACHPCPRCANKWSQSAPLVCTAAAQPLGRRARLSALTLAALATGYHPDGSAPEPGFLEAAAARCFAGKPQRCVRVKHAPCRPVFLPVDRGPGAARERMANLPRAAPRSAFQACPSGKAPSMNETPNT